MAKDIVVICFPVQAAERDLPIVHELVCRTIRAVYPLYYPAEAVEFFLDHHSPEHILEDIRAGNVWLLWVDGTAVATGTAKGDRMNRVFVLPEYQGKGYGSAMIDRIESVIGRRYGTIRLDASLPAHKIYLKRGYTPVGCGEHLCANGRRLFYTVMEKSLNK